MSSPLPTRSQYNRLNETLVKTSKEALEQASRANKAEAKVGDLEKRAENYLEIYGRMNLELELLKRKAADEEFNRTKFEPLCTVRHLTIKAHCYNCGAEDNLTILPDVILCSQCHVGWTEKGQR